jgi:putative two-component system response regulator
VLVAPSYLESLRSLLGDMGWEIEVATSAEDLKLALAENPPQVLILGADLPEADGFELCQTLKRQADRHEPRVIMVTDQHDSDQQLRAFQAGADEILTMPISRVQLVLRVQAQLLISRLSAA